MKTSHFSALTAISLCVALSCSSNSTPVYKLSTSVEPAGAGTITPASKDAEKGESVTITANSNQHWIFNSWLGDHTGTANPTTVTMNSDKSVTALFVKLEYPLNLVINGEGSVDQKVVQQKSTDYQYGTLVELTALPDEGWNFDEWGGDLQGMDPVNVIEIDGEKNVTATFKLASLSCAQLIDGNGYVYGTVRIGEQCWATENLRTSYYKDGSVITNVTEKSQWEHLTTGAWANTENDINNDAIYGKIYNGFAVADNRGLCPSGWKVPADDDWVVLEEFLGGSSIAGGKMKSTGTLEDGDGLWHAPNEGATNESGFSGIPGGARDMFGTFVNVGNNGVWWSSTKENDTSYWRRHANFNISELVRLSFGMSNGFSVRCLME